MSQRETVSIGQYLAARLRDIGVGSYFAVPGDYNLLLLDEFLKIPGFEQTYCCNELNAGYVADGYARANGIAAAVVTYSVGGLSIINAAAGAFAEDLPIVLISGAPNTDSAAKNRLLHHTLGCVDYQYVRDMFARVTAHAVTVRRSDEAASQIDHALDLALAQRKPVYIEIACNIVGRPIRSPVSKPSPPRTDNDDVEMENAVNHALDILSHAVKPVLVAGPKLRPWEAMDSFQRLVDASGYAMANMPNAKGFVNEAQRQYIGTYWGSVSSPGCSEIIESADAYLFAGPVFTDYTTVGYNLPLKEGGLIDVAPHTVKVADTVYDGIRMAAFLDTLAERVKPNETSLVAFDRIREKAPSPLKPDDSERITTRYLFEQIEGMLDSESVVVAETGDSWFNGIGMRLPTGCGFEIQMQYGSIGWSVGAALGYQIAAGSERRVIALIGDGSFQLTAQELSTAIRYGVKPIVFLMNNGGYTIEVEIHDGPYNIINNWDYAALIDVFNAEVKSNCLSRRVHTAGELKEAIEEVKGFDGLCFVEVVLDRDDCNKNLLKWGSYVATANSEPAMYP